MAVPPIRENPFGVKVVLVEEPKHTPVKLYSYKVVCERHGDIEPVGHKGPYDLGHCPECQKEHPGERYPHRLMLVPVEAEVTILNRND